MSNLRSKLYFLICAALIISAPLFSQVTDGAEDSQVITQGIKSAETGINYWTAEKNVSGVYCVDPVTKQICLDMESTCSQQIKKWTEELDYQVRLGSQYIVHSSSYWQAKKYLGWAKDALEGVRLLYQKTGIKELKFIITAMEEAISIAEKIVALFNK